MRVFCRRFFILVSTHSTVQYLQYTECILDLKFNREKRGGRPAGRVEAGRRRGAESLRSPCLLFPLPVHALTAQPSCSNQSSSSGHVTIPRINHKH